MGKDYTRKYYHKASHPLTKTNQNLIVSQALSNFTSKAEHLALSQSQLQNYLH